MTTLREAAALALEVWSRPDGINYVDFRPYMEALRTALSEPVQEPVARQMPDWMAYDPMNDVLTIHGRRYSAAMFGEQGFLSPAGTVLRVAEGQPDCVTLMRVTPTEPVQEPLTDEAIVWLMPNPTILKANVERWDRAAMQRFARAIERAHGIGGEA